MDGRVTHVVESARDVTGGVMSKAGERVRSGSKQVAEMLERGGSRTADALEESSAKVSTNIHRGVRGRVAEHPARYLLLTLLVAGVIAVMFARGRSSDEDDDWEL